MCEDLGVYPCHGSRPFYHEIWYAMGSWPSVLRLSQAGAFFYVASFGLDAKAFVF